MLLYLESIFRIMTLRLKSYLIFTVFNFILKYRTTQADYLAFLVVNPLLFQNAVVHSMESCKPMVSTSICNRPFKQKEFHNDLYFIIYVPEGFFNQLILGWLHTSRTVFIFFTRFPWILFSTDSTFTYGTYSMIIL